MALLLRASKVVEGKAEVLVDSGHVIIGRLPSNNLVIPGANVEPIHAMIEVDPDSGECNLVDMASDLGVRLNGRVVDVVEPLKTGDVIQIGEVKIEVLNPDTVLVPPPPPPGGEVKLELNLPPPPMPKPTEAQVRKTVVSPRVNKTPAVIPAGQDEERGDQKTARLDHGAMFQPGKERPAGSTLEVVAFWDQSILDVRHYGGDHAKDEQPRPKKVFIGNEEDGHIIGVGPKAATRNYLLAEVDGSKTTIFLDADMKGRIRKGGRFEKVAGPKEVSLSSKESALVRHGPIEYFLMNVSLPNPVLKKFEDLDGKPIIFFWGTLVYAVLIGLLMLLGPANVRNMDPESEAWDTVLTVRTPTPKPSALPGVKKQIEVPKPPKVEAPKVTPPPKKEPPKEKPKEKPKEQPKPPEKVGNPNGVPKGEKKANDHALGRPNPKAAPGNGGGPRGGTTGAHSGQRQGNDKTDSMGAEGGKKGVTSGINFDSLGEGLGKISDVTGVAAVATGLKSSSGGAGAGSGSGARGSHGFGGLGNGSSLATGGPAGALNGLGGGAGGMGSGGLGGKGGTGTGAFAGKLKAAAVVVPEGDPVTEGSLTQDEIMAVIRANLAQIKACYERNLQGNRNLQGRVATAFVIGGDGRVTKSEITQSALNSPGTENCIRSAIMRWKFPIPRGGGIVNVKYPFVFTPQ